MKVFVCLIPILLFVRCATTHVRVYENMSTEYNNLKKILVLKPDIKVEVKYLSVPKYFINKKIQENAIEGALSGYQAALATKGYVYCSEKELIKTSLYDSYSQKIKHELKDLGHLIIREDLEYYSEKWQDSELKRLHSTVPEEWKQYDAVIFLYGKAQLETDREFCMRWRSNAIYNVLALPASVIALIFLLLFLLHLLVLVSFLLIKAQIMHF